MTRRLSRVAAFLALVLAAPSVPRALALDEPERLWLVGEHAFVDGLYALARRELERFVERNPGDTRVAAALLMLGKAQLALGEPAPALDALQRALKFLPPPGQSLELRFWEGEALFRLKRYSEARAAYDEVLRNDAAGPFAPDALYGYGWTELEQKRPDAAITALRELLQTWPEHRLAPSATYQLARALVELKRYQEALALLRDLTTKFPDAKVVPDAQYLGAWTKLKSADTRGAVADLKAFVEAHPNHELAPEARKLLTQALARSGDKSELLEQYQALMQKSPPAPEALAEAMSIATRLGRPREHEAAWRKLRAEFPNHPVTHRTALDLADAAFKRKDWKEATVLAEIAAQSEDDRIRSEAWLLAGESALKLKRFSAAVKAFEGVGGIDSVEAGVRYRALAGLGLAREEQKELRAALSAYESVASKSPDPALRDWARERAAAVRSRIGKPPASSGAKRGSSS